MYNVEKMLMSVVTYGEFFSNGKYKNNYDILQQFIVYIMIKENLVTTTEVEIKEYLKKYFEFINLPLAVIRKVLENMFKNKTLKIEDGKFLIDRKILEKSFDDNKIEEYEERVKNNQEKIKKEMFDIYARSVNKELEEAEKTKIINEYNSYIRDSISLNEGNSKISKIILRCSEEIKNLIQDNINAYILFEGLNYDLDITTIEMSKTVKLYLDMEVLFDICGYNGEYYEKRALEMIKYVSEINKVKNNTIELLYLPVTKDYINTFFDTTKRIKFENAQNYKTSVAMEYIFKKCEYKKDIVVQKNNFFEMLERRFKIKIDVQEYYGNENNEYTKYSNNKEFYEKQYYKDLFDDDNEKISEKIEEGIKYFDVILKNRRNANTTNFFNSIAVFVTETKVLREMSKFLTNKEDGEFSNNYKLAITMNDVTNILWLKMSKGLGNINEINSNSVMMLAKMIIAKEKNWKLNKCVKKEQEKLKRGEISVEGYTAALAEIKRQSEQSKPEDINEENMDIDFDSIISKQAELEYKEKKFKENEAIIEKQQKENKKLEEEKEERESKIKEKDNKITILEESLNKEKKQNKRNIIVLIIVLCMFFHFNIGQKIIKKISEVLNLSITQNIIATILGMITNIIVAIIVEIITIIILDFVKQKFTKKNN